MLAAAGLLALFAILFGARRFERAGRSEGMVYAIALDRGSSSRAVSGGGAGHRHCGTGR
jgi:hypothetical protein